MGLIPYEDRALMVLFYARFEQGLRRESVLSDLTYGHDRDVAAWQQRRHDRVRERCTTCLLMRAYEFRNGHTYKPVRRFSVYRGEEQGKRSRRLEGWNLASGSEERRDSRGQQYSYVHVTRIEFNKVLPTLKISLYLRSLARGSICRKESKIRRVSHDFRHLNYDSLLRGQRL